MVWFWTRDQEELQFETMYDNDTGEFLVRLTFSNGEQRTERFVKIDKFKERLQQLERQLVEAHSATETANERLRAVEERLSHLDSEIAAVREQAERDSANDEARIRQTMEDEKKKIVTAAEQEITAAGAAAERRLRKFAAELAVDRATSRLHLTEGDDRTLIQEFAASLGSNGSRGGRN